MNDSPRTGRAGHAWMPEPPHPQPHRTLPGVRVFLCQDWRLVRQLRLRALDTDPDAFLTDEASERTRGDDGWERDAQAATWVAATVKDRGIGLVRSTRASDGTHVEALWVDRAHRRRGVATRLLQELFRIERERSVMLLVWVLDGNTAALALYRRLGFIPTGERQTLPDGRAEERFAIRLKPF